MDKVLNFQISLFGSFINIKPNLELTNRVSNALQGEGFFPTTAVVNSIDPSKKQITTEERLQLEMADHTWSVVFFEERIDFNYNYQGGDKFFTSITDVGVKGRHFVELVFKQFADTTGTRIAVNGRFLMKDLSKEKKQEFIRKFVTTSIIGSSSVTEWNLHINSPKEVLFGSKKELCNYIIDICDVVGINSKTKIAEQRLAVLLDINTDKDNTDFKYNYNDVLEFTNIATPMMVEALNDIEGDYK